MERLEGSGRKRPQHPQRVPTEGPCPTGSGRQAGMSANAHVSMSDFWTAVDAEEVRYDQAA